MKQINDNTGVYSRTGETPVTITNFTPEKLDTTSLAAYGIVLITDKALDIVFDTSKLATFTDPEPQINDTFVWDGRTYKVFDIAPADSPQNECFRYTTSSRQRMRVHLRQN